MNLDNQEINTKIIDNYFWFLENQLALKSPINLNQEKIKFFNSKYTYNPQFIYPTITKLKFEKQIIKSIKKIKNPDIRRLYLDKVREYQLRKDLASNIGNPIKFTQKSIELYSKPNQKTISIAQKIVNQMPPINFDRKNINIIRFKRLKKEINSYIKQSQLHGKIRIRHKQPVGNNISISKKTGRINISDNYIADKDELIDIIHHELETHMRRLENGVNQEYGIFKIGTAKYLQTEEGLAPILGHAFKKNKLLWHPALLVLAINKSLTSDFVAVFKTINNIIKEPFQSWSYTVRVKNGLTDTAKPGVYTKDLYLQYAIKIYKQLTKSPQLLKSAFNGKASLKQLEQFTQTPKHFQPKISIEDIKSLAQKNHFFSI